MDDEEEIFAEEKVELKPRERISNLLESADLKPQLDEFLKFEIKPDNLKIFKTALDQSHFYSIIALDEKMHEILKLLSCHPNFNKYFKMLMEKEEKKDKRKVHKIYDKTETELIEMIDALMEKLSQFIPRTMLIIEILKSGVDKYCSYIFSATPSMVKAPSFGRGRCKEAYDMWKEGKETGEICDATGIPMSQVWSYIRAEGKQRGDPKFVRAEA